MKFNFHLSMSLFVIVLVSFFVTVIHIPLETEVSETVSKSSLHPCQKTVMFQYELFKRNTPASPQFTREDVAVLNKFMSNRMDDFSNMLEQNCQDNTEEWLTKEYEMKMKKMYGSPYFP